MSEFLTRLPPPGTALKNYDRTKLHSEQAHEAPQSSTHIPHAFLHAMSIRESVFVEEQNVPLVNEYDADDPRSFHWVSYASVSRPSQPSTCGEQSSTGGPVNTKEEERRRSMPTSQKLPVGTIRLVPAPHPPHPAPSSSHKIDNSEAESVENPTQTTAPASSVVHDPQELHEVPGVGTIDPKEPYVKLGRLAILKPYRRLGMGRMLLDAATEWAAKHPEDVVPRPPTATERERSKEHMRKNSDSAAKANRRRSSSAAVIGRPNGSEADEEFDFGMNREYIDYGPWKGLILVHAQKHLENTYAKWGFCKDDAMGVWSEEGIEHIGMWKRVRVREQR